MSESTRESQETTSYLAHLRRQKDRREAGAAQAARGRGKEDRGGGEVPEMGQGVCVSVCACVGVCVCVYVLLVCGISRIVRAWKAGT